MIAKRILVVDSSEVVLERIKSRLTREGYHVTAARHAAVAERSLADCDLVLVDFHVPGIDCGEVLAGLRKAARAVDSQPLFFLYTSDVTISRIHRDLGFDGSIINKGDDESLVQQLGAALRLAKVRWMSGRPKLRPRR